MSKFRNGCVFLLAGVLGLMTGYASAASVDVPAEIARLARKEQSPEKRVEAFLQLGRHHVDHNRLDQAEVLYRRALAISERHLGATNALLILSLGHLASLYDRQQRYADAESLYRRSLVVMEKVLGTTNPLLVQTINDLAGLYRDQGKYVDAELLYKRSLAIRKRAFGADHTDVAKSLGNLARLYFDQGIYVQAEPLYKRALAIHEKALGPVHPDVIASLNNLAVVYRDQGQYAKAEPLYMRVLAIRENAYGAHHPDVAESLGTLADIYFRQGQYIQAEPLYKRSLAVRGKALGPDHPSVAISLNNLANLQNAQGRYEQAEALYMRALAIREKALGPHHPEVAVSLTNLALLHHTQGHYSQSESLYERSLAISEKAVDADPANVATTLNNLAEIRRDRGQYSQAEVLYRRALTIMETARGLDHPDVGTCVNNLALLYLDQGQHVQAEALLKRALAIVEKGLGPNHPSVATGLNNLANLYHTQHQYAQAEPLYIRSLEIMEKALGSDHPSVATSLNNLARVFHEQDRYAKVELIYGRSVAILEKALGSDHPSVATSLSNLADMHHTQERYGEAEPLYIRALAIREKALGPDHPLVATSLNNLAWLSSNQNQHAQALSYSRRASAISRKRDRDNPERQAVQERLENRGGIRQHISLLDKVAGQVSRLEITAEGFSLVQMIQGSDTANALARSVARFSAPSNELAEVVRREQDARARYQRLDEELVKALSAPTKARNPEKENRIRAEISQLDKEIERLGKILAERFPDYAALVSREPISLEDTQKILRSDEAMLVYVLDGDRAYLWVVRPKKAEFLPLAAKPSQIVTLANRVRASLVADNPLITPFDATAAYELYREIFAPALPHLDGVTDILVVPSGPLSGLPLGVLLGSSPKDGKLKLEDHRDLDWLIKRYRFATLPAVISLKALRKHGKAPLADQLPFIGIGDPVLDGDAGETRAGKSASGTELFPRRGSVANVEALRKLPSLPDTTDELKAIATALGADPGALYLRQRATESNAKTLPLDRYRILAFATHGLLSGEAKDLAEPGLVLTPPQQGTIDDDGYLGASEVAQLKLNADWVVLSACNTAAADGTPGAEGLTGLAKAFFYAGARALLVSHWPVISSATTRLITNTFQHHAKNPEQGKSGALQKAILDVINDSDRPEQAHPALWAPFVVVGDGR